MGALQQEHTSRTGDVLSSGLAAALMEREFFLDNLLVRINFVIEMILVDRSRAMEVLNSLFQVALHLPS